MYHIAQQATTNPFKQLEAKEKHEQALRTWAALETCGAPSCRAFAWPSCVDALKSVY